MSITSVPAFLGVELPPSFSLLGRRAFITGASRGIGKACALALASAGADIAVGSSSAGAVEAEEVCAKLRAMGRRAEAVAFDVRAVSEKAIQSVLDITPVGRLGDPMEIGASVLYLASPAAGFVTGHVLDVNGGMAM